MVREPRGLTSRTYTTPCLMAYCTLISPTTPSRSANARVCRRICSTCSSVIRYGGSTQAESPEWMPGVLDVLHDAADDAALCRREMASTSASKASSRKLSISTGCSGATRAAHPKKRSQRLGVVDDLAWPGRRARTTGAPGPGSRSGPPRRSLPSTDRAVPLAGCVTPSSRASASNRPRSSAASMASGEVPRIGTPAASRPLRQLERRLPAELDHDADRLLDVDDLEHVLEGQRLEVERVGDVEVGGHRLRIRVHHDGAVAQLAERQRPPGRSSSRTRRPARSGSGRCPRMMTVGRPSGTDSFSSS